MLYPTNIRIKKEENKKNLIKKVNIIKNKFKNNIKYLVFDRNNFFKRIKVKIHV